MLSFPSFYSYFEEIPIDDAPGMSRKRRKDVSASIHPSLSTKDLKDHWPSSYPWWKTRELEHREAADLSEGVWPINHNRVERYHGDPGQIVVPMEAKPEEWPPNVSDLAYRFRLHHYCRVWNSSQAITLLKQHPEVRLSLEITEDWFDPKDGHVCLPHSNSPIIGSHAVPIVHYDNSTERFCFRNSWGPDWGHEGAGSIPKSVFDDYLIESWCLYGPGLMPPLQTKSGLVCLLWKAGERPHEVHGREIVDAETHERIAWAFAVRQGSILNIEEMFVWPSHRNKGFGSKLVEMLRTLAQHSKTTLRACVPFADCVIENRPALVRILELFGLSLHPSTCRTLGYEGLSRSNQDTFAEPIVPTRPAVSREKLDPSESTRCYTVWFGTNRKPNNPTDLSAGFSSIRDDQVYYGKCRVAIPKHHKFGSVGSAWYRRWFRWKDDRLKVINQTPLDSETVWGDIYESLSHYPPESKHGLVFLHGYNVSFNEAAIRAAQLGFDLKISGVTVFFSWPSAGSLSGYMADSSSIEASEHSISKFLLDFVERGGMDYIHVIAHSMGNRGLVRALSRITQELTNVTKRPFAHLILAAPDIDADFFRQQLHVFSQAATRTTLYSSPSDRALKCSTFLHHYPRVGLSPPVFTFEGIDTIEIPSFNLFELLGHNYYAEAAGVLGDMFDLIVRNAAPSERQRLVPAVNSDGLPYWTMLE